MVGTPSGSATAHRDLIVTLAARASAAQRSTTRVPTRGLPAAWAPTVPIVIDQYRRAAGYVDRILKGEKPADLPVMAANEVRAWRSTSRTAKALGLAVPGSPAVRCADEVIE